MDVLDVGVGYGCAHGHGGHVSDMGVSRADMDVPDMVMAEMGVPDMAEMGMQPQPSCCLGPNWQIRRSITATINSFTLMRP